MDLRADWKAVKVPGRRRPVKAKTAPVEDIHEDWAAVRGIKYPPYGYILKWEYPTAFVVWKLKIVGKVRTRAGVLYKTQTPRILFKTKDYETRWDRPGDGLYPRSCLCFTLEEVERTIEVNRRRHLDHLSMDMQKLHEAAEEISIRLRQAAENLRRVREDPIPWWILEKIPSRKKAREQE